MAETERKLRSIMELHSLVTGVGFDVNTSDEDAGPEMEACTSRVLNELTADIPMWVLRGVALK
ncbi:hypothetical protein LTS18_006678, partial [Coniosporium uncinatum]